MLTTAAGTIRPAKVMVMGVGVAGLMAIATAKRLGAQVFAYDVRKAALEQALSLGAKPIELPISAEGEGATPGSSPRRRSASSTRPSATTWRGWTSSSPRPRCRAAAPPSSSPRTWWSA